MPSVATIFRGGTSLVARPTAALAHTDALIALTLDLLLSCRHSFTQEFSWIETYVMKNILCAGIAVMSLILVSEEACAVQYLDDYTYVLETAPFEPGSYDWHAYLYNQFTYLAQIYAVHASTLGNAISQANGGWDPGVVCASLPGNPSCEHWYMLQQGTVFFILTAGYHYTYIS